MPRINAQPAAVRVYWKYRSESMQTRTRGAILNQPSLDSDGTIDGIQNESLFPVPFIPRAEVIDLYYQPLNSVGRGPAVDIVATPATYALDARLVFQDDRTSVRGAIADLNLLRRGDMLRIDDEIVVISSLSKPFETTLHDGLRAFWGLTEAGGVRQNIYPKYNLTSYIAGNVPGNAAGPQSGVNAASFDGTQALYTPYAQPLSLAGTHITGFTMSCWVYLASKNTSQHIISRWGRDAAGRREFLLQYDAADDRFKFSLQNADQTVVELNSGISPQTNRWYFVHCWFEPRINTLYISAQASNVQNADIQSTARLQNAESPHTSGELMIGASLYETSSSDINLVSGLNGRISNVGFWRRVLHASERNELYVNHVVSSQPHVFFVLGDRGAHGTDDVQHEAGADVVRMRATVPTNSLVMDALSDPSVPGAPASLVVSASGDDAEVGMEVTVTPPLDNTKTINRIQIQASIAPLFPANIEHTTGLHTILSGPHTGTIRQGQKVLVSDVDLPVTAVAPYFLYTYGSLDVDTGVVFGGAGYGIESIGGRNVNIERVFNVRSGRSGTDANVNFIIARDWLSAPRDYVINDTPIVTAPALGTQAHEPFQRFYKTTQSVYVRARYANGQGAGPWMYWDNVFRVATTQSPGGARSTPPLNKRAASARSSHLTFAGSVDRTEAVQFHASGISIPDIDVPPERHTLQVTTDIELRPVNHNTVQWDSGQAAYSDGSTENISNSGSPHVFSGLEYVYKRFNSNTLRFTSSFITAIGDDRTLLGQIIAGDIGVDAEATVMMRGDARGPIISIQNLAVNMLSALTANLGSVTSGVMTGVTVQTAVAGLRIAMSSALGLRAYASGGTEWLRLSGDGMGSLQPARISLNPNLVGTFVISGGGKSNDRGLMLQSRLGSAGGLQGIHIDDGLESIDNTIGRIRIFTNNIFRAQFSSAGLLMHDNIDMNTRILENARQIHVGSIYSETGGTTPIVIQGALQLNTNATTAISTRADTTQDIGTFDRAFANFWGNAFIGNALGLDYFPSNFAAQANRGVLFIQGGDLKCRFANGTLRTIVSD